MKTYSLVAFQTVGVSLAIFAAMVGCCRNGSPRTARQTNSATAKAARIDSGPPVTEEESRALAEALELAIAIDDKAGYRSLFDLDAVIETAMRGIDLPQRTKLGFVQGLTAEMSGSGGFLAQVAASLKQDGSYQLMEIYQEQNRWRARFRFWSPEQGLNYHELILGRSPDQQVRIVDAYILALGELFSMTLRRMILEFAASENRSFVERLSGNERSMVTHMDDVQRLAEAVRQGRPQVALDIYHGLPKDLQKQKTLLAMRLTVAGTLQDENEIEQAFLALKHEYPHDASLDLMSIDYHIGREEFDDALAAVDRLDKSVNGDRYLDMMRANVFILAGELEKARELIHVLIQEQPELGQAYWTAASVELAAKDHAATLAWLKRIDQNFDVQWNDLTLEPDYADFIQSPAYQAWLAYLNNQ